MTSKKSRFGLKDLGACSNKNDESEVHPIVRYDKNFPTTEKCSLSLRRHHFICCLGIFACWKKIRDRAQENSWELNTNQAVSIFKENQGHGG